jgi:hypothetical protein
LIDESPLTETASFDIDRLPLKKASVIWEKFKERFLTALKAARA